jgi:hypothetical protein
MSKRTRKLLLAVVGLVVAIQLVPVWHWQTNPPVTGEPPWDTPLTRTLARGACFDCHSNETVWPVYAHVAPVSWLVTSDVVEGRAKLDFSTWSAARAGDGRVSVHDIVEAVRSGDMPPLTYRLMHPAARLRDRDRTALIAGLEATLR